MSITFKIQFQEELRRLTLPQGISWNELNKIVGDLFPLLKNSSFVLKYPDEDGDLITLSTDMELLHLISQVSSTQTPLRLQVVPSYTKKLDDNATSITAQSTEIPLKRTAESVAEGSKFKSSSEDLQSNPIQGHKSSTEEILQPKESNPTEATSSRKEKGKEKEKVTAEEEEEEEEVESNKSDESSTQDEEKKEEEEQDVSPSLEDILGGFEKLRENIQEIFDQHPEIQENLQNLTEQFGDFISKEFERKRKEWHETRQREEQARQERFKSFQPNFPAHPFFVAPFFQLHQQQQQQQHQQQQQQHQPCFGSSRSGCGSSSSQDWRRMRRMNQFQDWRSRGQGSCAAAPAAPPSHESGFIRGGIVEEKLRKLGEMGFIDRELNVKLLRKNLGDLNATLEDLQSIHSQLFF